MIKPIGKPVFNVAPRNGSRGVDILDIIAEKR